MADRDDLAISIDRPFSFVFFFVLKIKAVRGENRGEQEAVEAVETMSMTSSVEEGWVLHRTDTVVFPPRVVLSLCFEYQN